MKPLAVLAFLIVLAPQVFAQAPVEDAPQRQDAVLQGQQKTGVAYRELQRAEYTSKLAEQDFLNADAAYKAAQKQATDLQHQAQSAKKNLDEAKAKEARARQAYQRATNAVSETGQKPVQK